MREIVRTGRLVSGMRYVRRPGLYEYTSPVNIINQSKVIITYLTEKFCCTVLK